MHPFRTLALVAITFPLLWHTDEAASSRDASGGSRLILLDVDNTIYREEYAGIESQIVHGTHSYCRDVLGMDKETADDLYKQYGSTIEGLRHTTWKDLSEAELREKLWGFYHAVYDVVDPSSVLRPETDAGGSGSTGYSHDSREENKMARQLLKSSPLPLAWASNSPSWHVRRVLRALGLARLSSPGDRVMFTPDRLPWYPTKNQPEAFFASSNDEDGDDYSSCLDLEKSISFLDDSLFNLNRVREAFPHIVDRVHHINRKHENERGESSKLVGNGEENVVQALLQDFGLIDPGFRLSQTKYLESKNKVDIKSLNVGIWNKVVGELEDKLLKGVPNDGNQLTIVDLGAGLLSMLDLLLHGDDENGLAALVSAADSKVNTIRYTAYESNQELYESCNQRLLSWGFGVVEDGTSDAVDYQKEHNGKMFRVRLVLRNFVEGDSGDLAEGTTHPDLIIGCCFADLMDPEQLVPDLMRSFGLVNLPSSLSTRGTLIYFPITFTGTTQFLPPGPFGFRSDGKTIPSDTVGFRSYSRALDTVLGHNLDPHLLQDIMEDYGAKLIDFGASDWKIDPEKDAYLHKTMLYFFGSTGGPQLLKEGWDAPGWIQRARNNRPAIRVSNRDLLFRVLPDGERDPDHNIDTEAEKEAQLSEISFTAPYQVTTVQKDIPSQLGPRQVLVRASYSLISSGTELKIFKGNFDDDAALDVNIKDMEDERMAYPLSYGYCLVGVVVDCGSDVSRKDFVGKNVFTFSPHSTHVVTDADAVQILPSGIDPKDAIFMPSVETALSLVHDANVRIGENVAVYGQGLIGLLVTALLSQGRSDEPGGWFNSITTFDMFPDRLAASSKMGASQALVPGNKDHEGFDVSIEVSGNFRALQSAIDQTLNGGRVIVGSWYGSKDVSLKLGIDFHRSHKTIQTSQVSEIPANLSRLWSKERRFAYTWDLVKQIRPSRLLTKIISLDEAQDAYEALDNGSEIAIAFDYNR